MNEPQNLLSAMRNTLQSAESKDGEATRENALLAQLSSLLHDTLNEEGTLDEGLQALQQERQRSVVGLSSAEIQFQSLPQDDESLSTLMERLRRLHAEYEEAIAKLTTSFEGRNRVGVDSALAEMNTLGDKLNRSHMTFRAAARAAETGEGHERATGLPKTYVAFLDLTGRMARGEVDIKTWAESLQDVQEKLSALREYHIRGMNELKKSEEVVLDPLEEQLAADMTFGLDEALAAVGRLFGYVKSRDAVTLELARKAFLDGLMRVQNALAATDDDADPEDVVRIGYDE